MTKDFGKGYTESNLKYMRMFIKTFNIRHAVRDKLSWTHYRLLLSVKNSEARDFYFEQAITNNWSTRQLEREMFEDDKPPIGMNLCADKNEKSN